MERTLDKFDLISEKNEKIIANILHDIKSPLYSIKIALQNKLNNELNRDIYETILDTIEYIENFLTNYNFKTGVFDNKIENCDIKNIITKQIENCKYLFIDKNININIIDEINKDYVIKSIKPFLASILGNIISNMALHGAANLDAVIKLKRKKDCILLNFQNNYTDLNKNFSLGLKFCEKLSKIINADIKFNKTSNLVIVEMKIQNLND